MRSFSVRAMQLCALALCLLLVRPTALLAQDCVVSVGVAAGTTVQDLTVVNGRWLFPDTRNTTFFSTTHAGYYQLTGTVRVQQQSDFGGAQDVDYKKFLISVDGVLVDSEAPRKPTNPPAGWTGGFAGLNTIFETKDISPVQLFLAAGAHSLTIFFSGDCQPTSEFNTHGIFGVFSGQLTCATPSIQASLSDFSISCGQSSQVVTATGSPAGGTFSDWAVSDTRVATVGAVSGNQATITAVAGGQAILSVKYSNLGETVLATRAFTVTSDFTVSLAGPTGVTCGTTADYAVTLSPPHADATITPSFDMGGSLVEVVSTSATSVRLHYKDPGPLGTSVVLRVTVTSPGCPPATATRTILVSRPVLTLTASPTSVSVGETATVTLAGAPAGEPVTWSASSALAFGDTNTGATTRTVRGVSASTAATVTAEVCGVTASVTIQVLGGGVTRDPKRSPGPDGSGLPEPPVDGEGGSGGSGDEPAPDCTEPAADARQAGAVYLHSGEEHQRVLDLFVRGRGDIHFQLVREYRSRVVFDGPIGHGWDFSYNEHLSVLTNGDVLHVNGLGRADTYALLPSGTFAAPAGFFRVLLKETDGTYVLRDRAGFKRSFDVQGNLAAHEDRNGNRMTFAHDASGRLERAIDVFGRAFAFAWREDGRLASVTDFAGRTVTYGYNDARDLVSVTSPAIVGTSTGNDFPLGRTTRYTYSSGFTDEDLNHNLLTVTAPEEVETSGPPRLQITYGTNASDPSTYDKVISVVKGGTNATGVPAGGTWSFRYEAVTDPAAAGLPALVVRKATLTDPAGNVSVEAIDALGRLRVRQQLTRGLRPGEPPFFCTIFDYNEDSLVVRATRPLGNVTEYVYESASASRFSQRNLIEIRQNPDAARGGGEPLVTRMTYEPLFNQVASVTDARGGSTSFTPPIGVATAERYTTRFLFDYEESSGPIAEATKFGIDLSGIPRGLGDLNGDGRTDQAGGNVVRVQAPSVTLLADSNEARLRGTTAQPIVTELAWNDAGELVRTVDPEGNVATLDYYPENDPDGDGTPVNGATSTAPRGYLRTATRDADTSPRRRASAPPARIATSFGYDPLGRVTALTNPRGIVTTFEWNAVEELVATTRAKDVSAARASGQLLLDQPAFAYVTRTSYDANGCPRRVEIENRDGNVPELGTFIERTFECDILDRRVTATARVDGQTTLTTTFRYTPNELLAVVTKPEGNQTKIEYDERNLVLRATRGFGSAEASTVQRNYDANGNLFEILDAQHRRPDGTPTRTTFAQDGFDRVATVTDELAGRVELAYDPVSSIVRQRLFGHPAGRPQDPVVLLAERRFSHDELSRAFETNVPLFLAQGFTTRRPVDLREGSLTHGDGLVTTRTEWDALSRPTFLVEDDRQTWQTVYDGASRAVASIDPLGNRRETDFDQSSNPVRARSIEVSPEHRVPQETFEILYVWDALDRLARVTDNAGQTATLRHDSRDNLIDTSDAMGPLVQDPLGLYVRGPINSGGNTVHFFHDGLNRLVKKVMDLRAGGQGGGAVTGTITNRTVWDGNTRLAGLFDDKGNATLYQFDALDRPIREMSADLTFRTTSYDRNDNPITSIDANGTVVGRTFDVLNRLTRVDVTLGPLGQLGGTTLQQFEHDGLSRLTRALDTAGTQASEVSFVYDSLGRVLEEVQDGYAVSHVWAGDGRRLACTYPGGLRLDYENDTNKRLKRITQNGQAVASYDWIGPGYRLLRRLAENGTKLTLLDASETADLGWDAVQRVQRLRHVFPDGTSIADLAYGYDRASNRLFEARLHAGRTDGFSYDSVYRLATAQYEVAQDPSAPVTGVKKVTQEAFAFDGVGNRTSLVQTKLKQDGTLATHTTSYVANAVNEYTQIGATAQAHDPSGNLLDDGKFSYRYDFRNLLVELKNRKTGRVAFYRYDALGRRIEKTWGRTEPEDDDDPGDDDEEDGDEVLGVVHLQRYLFDGARVIEQRRTNGTLRKEWVVGVGLDEPIRMTRFKPSGVVKDRAYFHQNAIGSVVAITNAQGAVVERYKYLAFGREQIFDPAGNKRGGTKVGNPIRFQGRWRDQAEGSPLYQFRARYYDPRTGRFSTRDPIGGWGDPEQLGNGYGFCGNNGVTYVDPLGLQGAPPPALAVTVRFKNDPALTTKDLWTLGGERMSQAIVQAWFDVALTNLQTFAKAPWGTPPTIVKNGWTAAQVGTAVNALIAALKANPAQTITLTTDVKVEGSSSSTEGTGNTAIIRINPAQSESNFFVAQSIMHELLHKYGDVPEKPYPQVMQGGKCVDAQKDLAQMIVDFFFAKPNAPAVAGAQLPVPAWPQGAPQPTMFAPSVPAAPAPVGSPTPGAAPSAPGGK